MTLHRQLSWGWSWARWALFVGLLPALVAWSSGAPAPPDPKAEPAAKAAPDEPDEPGPDEPEKPEPKPNPKPEAKPGEKAPPEKPGAEKPGADKPAPSEPDEAAPPEKPAPEPVPAQAKPAPIVELEVDDSQRALVTRLGAILGSEKLTDEQRKQLDDFYEKYALARWTKQAERAEVRKYRSEFLRQLASAAPAAHEHVVKLALDALGSMATGKLPNGEYQAVARVNAMLAVGELNAAEARGGSAPTPLPEAQPVLLAALEDRQLPDAVRVAALVGITRHAELGALTGNNLNQALSVLVAQATSPAPAGRSPAGHAWMRSMAIDALAALKTPGQAGQVVGALVGILADAGAPLSVRAAAARALGSLAYPGGFQTDVGKMVREMAQVALDAVQEETERYPKEKKLVRRRVQTHLIAVYSGLTGMASLAAQQADADLHGKVLAAVRACLQTLEDAKKDDSQVVLDLVKHSAQLTEAAAAPAKPAAAPPAKPEG